MSAAERETMTLELCPFCGGDAEIIEIHEGENAGGSCVQCKRCMASSNVEFERKENFVSNWNRRAHLSRTAEPMAWIDPATVNSARPLAIKKLEYMSCADTTAGVKFIPVYAEPRAQPASVAGDWRKPAASWLREKADEQRQINTKYPDHVRAYPSWETAVLRFEMLARELESTPSQPETAQESGSLTVIGVDHGSPDGDCTVKGRIEHGGLTIESVEYAPTDAAKLRALEQALQDSVGKIFSAYALTAIHRHRDELLAEPPRSRDADNRTLWGVVANAGRLSNVRKQRWAHVVDATGQGSNRSAELCRRFGFDPDQETGGGVEAVEGE